MDYKRTSCAYVNFPTPFFDSRLLSVGRSTCIRVFFVIEWPRNLLPFFLDGWIFSPSPVRFLPGFSLVQKSSSKNPDRPFLPILLLPDREEPPIPPFKSSNGHVEMPPAIDTSGSKIVSDTTHTSEKISISIFLDLDGLVQATVVERCRSWKG